MEESACEDFGSDEKRGKSREQGGVCIGEERVDAEEPVRGWKSKDGDGEEEEIESEDEHDEDEGGDDDDEERSEDE